MKIDPNKTRILHIGSISGGPQNLRDGQRLIGHKSEVLSFGEHPFKYEVDISYSSKVSTVKRINRIVGVLRKSYQYDILHFHTSSFRSSGIDLIIWKLLGKKVIMHYHGSEIRNKKQPILHKYFVDKYIVSTPDLLPFVPKSIWLPNPIDSKKYPLIMPDPQINKLKILHAPSSRKKKGTEYLIQAIDKLKKEGYDIEFILLENKSHNEVLKQIESSDIVVDQLIIGWYGMFSIEAMCMGKPVLCYIRQDLIEINQELPIINTTPESIYVNLIKLIENPKQRIELGILGRTYVEKTHDSRIVIKKLTDFYN